MTGYVDGKSVLSFTDNDGTWKREAAVRFGKDNSSEETGGQFARIRLYDAALSGADVRALDRLPSGTADIAVTNSDTPDPVARGAFLSYSATVRNNGPADALGVKVTLTLPAGAPFQGTSPSRGTCAAPSGGRVVCTIGSMGVGASEQVLLVLKAPAGTGPISSTATATATSSDPAPGNGSATQQTVVR